MIKEPTAYKIAIECIQDKQRRLWAGGEALHRAGDRSVWVQRDHNQYRRHQQAIEILLERVKELQG